MGLLIFGIRAEARAQDQDVMGLLIFKQPELLEQLEQLEKLEKLEKLE